MYAENLGCVLKNSKRNENTQFLLPTDTLFYKRFFSEFRRAKARANVLKIINDVCGKCLFGPSKHFLIWSNERITQNRKNFRVNLRLRQNVLKKGKNLPRFLVLRAQERAP